MNWYSKNLLDSEIFDGEKPSATDGVKTKTLRELIALGITDFNVSEKDAPFFLCINVKNAGETHFLGTPAEILEEKYGYHIPKDLAAEFRAKVVSEQQRTDSILSDEQLLSLFTDEYVNISSPYNLISYRVEEHGSDVSFEGTLEFLGKQCHVRSSGNGPVNAFFNALDEIGIKGYEFVTYYEHALTEGADSKAIAYIKLKSPGGDFVYGTGADNNILVASIRGIICAINRSVGK